MSGRFTFFTVLATVGMAALAAITVTSLGGTRMYASPWTLAYAVALLTPPLLLILRCFDRAKSLQLPPASWMWLTLSFAGVVIASALFSPYGRTSLQWTAPLLSAVALFFILFDTVQNIGSCQGATSPRIQQILLLVALVLNIASIGWWLTAVVASGRLFVINGFPLGHASYTAGLALLTLPLGVAAVRWPGKVWRTLGISVCALALLMLLTSGSRGGMLGLAVLCLAALWQAPFSRGHKFTLLAGGLVVFVAFLALNPRTRALFTTAETAVTSRSNTERAAMFTAGWRMGSDRPLLGWGPGTTPLAYPRYRATLQGGAENVLQLHSTPVNLWAELGIAGVICGVLFGVLAWRARRHAPLAATTLLGYGVFALTDWQLDVPIFGALLAAWAAQVATSIPSLQLRRATTRIHSLLVGAAAIAGVGVISLLGQRDSVPELNSRALLSASSPEGAGDAIALLRESLAHNSDQEIAHFNLGWLLLVSEPASAERHFLAAARLVPDKGGVYFGLGLARRNQGKLSSAAHAFALECINDPSFLASPWWSEPAISALKPQTAENGRALVASLPPRYRTLFTVPSNSSGDPFEHIGAFISGTEINSRRVRSGYPVLMRNLDIPPPVDLFDVRQATPAQPLPPLPKGWLPAPFLLQLLDRPLPGKS